MKYLSGLYCYENTALLYFINAIKAANQHMTPLVKFDVPVTLDENKNAFLVNRHITTRDIVCPCTKDVTGECYQ